MAVLGQSSVLQNCFYFQNIASCKIYTLSAAMTQKSKHNFFIITNNLIKLLEQKEDCAGTEQSCHCQQTPHC